MQWKYCFCWAKLWIWEECTLYNIYQLLVPVFAQITIVTMEGCNNFSVLTSVKVQYSSNFKVPMYQMLQNFHPATNILGKGTISFPPIVQYNLNCPEPGYPEPQSVWQNFGWSKNEKFKDKPLKNYKY